MTADALSKYKEEDFPTPGPLVVCDPCVSFYSIADTFDSLRYACRWICLPSSTVVLRCPRSIMMKDISLVTYHCGVCDSRCGIFFFFCGKLAPLTDIFERYGIRAFDTSPYYGCSEIVLGKILDCLRDEFPRSSYQLVGNLWPCALLILIRLIDNEVRAI